MAEIANPNLPTYFLNAATVATRNGEYTGTPFTDVIGDGSYANPYLGCNRAGSCAPGIGIATGVINPKLDDWSLLQQSGSARITQNSQHIGSDGLGAGQEGSTGATDLNVRVSGTDYNDTLSYIAAVVQAAPGAGYNTAGADPKNRTDQTIEIGERLWGTNDVA